MLAGGLLAIPQPRRVRFKYLQDFMRDAYPCHRLTAMMQGKHSRIEKLNTLMNSTSPVAEYSVIFVPSKCHLRLTRSKMELLDPSVNTSTDLEWLPEQVAPQWMLASAEDSEAVRERPGTVNNDDDGSTSGCCTQLDARSIL